MVEVHRAESSVWRIVRDVRLRALADAPTSFGSSYEREAAYVDDVWIERLATCANATFLCEGTDSICGMLTIVRDAAHSSLGWLVGMWVAPSERGTGAADALMESALYWAERELITVVRLLVYDDNGRAVGVYRRHGFRETGHSLTRDAGGRTQVVMERVLTL
jgi:GNAT superfamily N-acetyltransferase